ncbi:hypothetical protein LIS66_08330 [Pseudomonas sp. HN2]|nr:hypothetical protein LIS66_08330 [Pseudomonas sp. HN2]
MRDNNRVGNFVVVRGNCRIGLN